MTLDDFDAAVDQIWAKDMAYYYVPEPAHFRSDVYDEEYDQQPYSEFVWQFEPFLDVRIEIEYDFGLSKFTLCVQDALGFVVYKEYAEFPGGPLRSALANVYVRAFPFAPAANKPRMLDRSHWVDFYA